MPFSAVANLKTATTTFAREAKQEKIVSEALKVGKKTSGVRESLQGLGQSRQSERLQSAAQSPFRFGQRLQEVQVRAGRHERQITEEK